MLAEVMRLELEKKNSLLVSVMAVVRVSASVSPQALITGWHEEDQVTSAHMVGWIPGEEPFRKDLREPKSFPKESKPAWPLPWKKTLH